MGLRGFVILAASFIVIVAEPSENTAVESVIESINQFAPTFFKEITNGTQDNLISSPLNIAIALAMFAYGSSGKTEEEFKRVLHLPEKSVGKIGYPNLIDSLNSADDVELRLTNKIFINEDYIIGQTYHDLIQTTFRSAFQNLNFANVQKALDTINEWIKKNIKDRHADVLTPDILPENPNIVLVNIIYFKAYWGGRFTALQGGKKPFYITKSNTKDVTTLYNVRAYGYGYFPALKATLVEIPYENEDFSMVIVLPEIIDGLAKVEQKLAQQDITKLVERLNKTRVEVTLPEFKIESTIDLIPVLKNMGLKRAFSEEGADFPEIFDIGLYIDSFVQKAFIAVDERGSHIRSSGRSEEKAEIFYADHPFHLSILKRNKLTNKKFELFSAHVVNP